MVTKLGIILGLVYYKLEKYQEAIKAYQKAIEIQPDYQKTWNNLGLVYYKLEKYQESIKAYKKAIEIKPDDLILIIII